MKTDIVFIIKDLVLTELYYRILSYKNTMVGRLLKKNITSETVSPVLSWNEKNMKECDKR